jgi:hypothetical protein
MSTCKLNNYNKLTIIKIIQTTNLVLPCHFDYQTHYFKPQDKGVGNKLFYCICTLNTSKMENVNNILKFCVNMCITNVTCFVN